MKRSTVLSGREMQPHCWRLRLSCGHEADVWVGHRPAIGGGFTCPTCPASEVQSATEEKKR